MSELLPRAPFWPERGSVAFTLDRDDARRVHEEIHRIVLTQECFQLDVPDEPTPVPFWSETVMT